MMELSIWRHTVEGYTTIIKNLQKKYDINNFKKLISTNHNDVSCELKEHLHFKHLRLKIQCII